MSYALSTVEPDRSTPDGHAPQRRSRTRAEIRAETRKAVAAGKPTPERWLSNPLDAEHFFGRQSSHSAQLPDPEPLIVNLAHCVLEVVAGVRELDQLARWISDEVYQSLRKRVSLSARARAAKQQEVQRPQLTVMRTTQYSPRDGIVEAVVVVKTAVRVRAVAIRLEGLDRRWRASAISLL